MKLYLIAYLEASSSHFAGKKLSLTFEYLPYVFVSFVFGLKLYSYWELFFLDYFC